MGYLRSLSTSYFIMKFHLIWNENNSFYFFLNLKVNFFYLEFNFFNLKVSFFFYLNLKVNFLAHLTKSGVPMPWPVCPACVSFIPETTAAMKLKFGKHFPSYEDTWICLRHSKPKSKMSAMLVFIKQPSEVLTSPKVLKQWSWNLESTFLPMKKPKIMLWGI